MADWPELAELSQVLNVPNEGDWETTLGRVRSAAIAIVKSVRGAWDDDVDEPDENLAQAALRAAELIAERPSATPGTLRSSVLADPAFQALMTGRRRRFGVS